MNEGVTLNAIAVHWLRESEANTEMLRSLELELGEGRIYGLLGRKGAVMATALSVLVGLRRPNAGIVASRSPC